MQQSTYLFIGNNSSKIRDFSKLSGGFFALTLFFKSFLYNFFSLVWKYLKLVEVTVSPDPDNAHVSGSVSLVYDGCRNIEFASIIPHQPARYRERYNEVFLDFEAFLLSTMQERAPCGSTRKSRLAWMLPIVNL